MTLPLARLTCGVDRAAGLLMVAACMSVSMAMAGAPRPAAASVGSEGRLPTAAAKTAEARRHFQRGVELYNDGDSSAALAEFSRSYQIVPAFKVLYNMGQLSYQRQDYVTALAHFRRYLAEGGDQIATERRKQVEQDIRRLEQRIGRIEIDTHEDGADILLDDINVAKAPLVEPIVANVGRRKVGFVSKMGPRQTRWVDVAGGETVHVRFEGLSAPSALSQKKGPWGEGVTEGVLDRPRTAASGQGALALVPPATPPRNLIAKAALPPEAGEEDEEDAAPAPRRGKWLAWTAAGLLAAGAATTGAFAFSASRELQRSRDAYPVASQELEAEGRRARILGWTSDGLLAGTALLTAWAIYLTTSD